MHGNADHGAACGVLRRGQKFDVGGTKVQDAAIAKNNAVAVAAPVVHGDATAA
jgi:hypothetical protein